MYQDMSESDSLKGNRSVSNQDIRTSDIRVSIDESISISVNQDMRVGEGGAVVQSTCRVAGGRLLTP